MSALYSAEGPRKRWHLGAYEFTRYARTQTGPGWRGRWGCCYRNSRGAANCRSPFTAFIALRRSMRVPARPVEE
jgi:hypothetical protein